MEYHMNILIINGSPKGKRSNSLRLTNAFLKGVCKAKEASGEVTDIRQIDVSKLHIEGCKGCFACWKKTPGQCCIHDDMAAVLSEILWADVILYSFPLYYFHVPGTMKNVIDRQLPMVLPFMSERSDGIGSGSHESRYDMSGKKYVLISTCGFYSAAGNYDSVRGMFDHLCGKDNYETIFCGQGELFGVKELSARTDEYLAAVEQAGMDYVLGGISQATRTKLQQLLYPKEIFEKMADASWGIDRESGEETDESLIFTRQMAALYNKNRYDGTDRVLEMYYTDQDKTYQIALTATGSEVYTDGHLTATTRIETPYHVWIAIAKGEIRGDVALAQQKYRVTGDFSLMMQWDRFFGSGQGTSEEEMTAESEAEYNGENTAERYTGNGMGKAVSQKPPVMTTMLTAWITFWIAVSIHPQVGAWISLGVCACLPLMMNHFVLHLYDKLSMAVTALLSIFSLATGQGSIAVNVGYLLFGLMWLGSCLTKEPLCAAYVKYQYNGEDALKNPIFMKTNQILAAGWGILYILIAVWTWGLSRTSFAGFLVIVNNIMPMIMGIFTGWFQKWYPAWVAGGRR